MINLKSNQKYLTITHCLIISLMLSTLLCPTLASAFDGSGHYDDTSWSGLSDVAGYDNISVDITPKVWAGGSDGYYYSNNAVFTNNTNIYGGLQTNGFDGSRWIGKMAIFSIWNVSNGIAESGGTGTPFGGEGTGYSIRLPFNWQVGTSYRFNIYIDQDSSSGNRLWAASITNLSNGSVSRIGRIYAPVSYGKIHNPVTFHERYSANPNNCSEILPSQVSFTNMTANNGSVRSSGWNHYVIKNVPECPNITWTSEDSLGYTSGINTAKPNPTSPSSPVSGSPSVPKTTPTKTTSPAKSTATPAKSSIAVIGKSKEYPKAKNTFYESESTHKWSRLKILVIFVMVILLIPMLVLLVRHIVLNFKRKQIQL